MTGSRLRICGAEVLGQGLADVRIVDGRIVEIAPGLAAMPEESVLDADGGALLPGLHDHHLHLFAWAAADASTACGPADVADESALARALVAARRDERGWVRGVDYHESVAGDLDAARIDAWRADVPVRIQHRTGSLWVLNGEALREIGVGETRGPNEPAGVERNAAGRPSGRIFRADAWLRERIGGTATWPDLSAVGQRLACFGVSGVTDATPSNGPEEVEALMRARVRGEFVQRVSWMGGAALSALSTREAAPWWKLVLDERTLDTVETLAARISRAHAAGRPVAVHCVERAALFVLCAAFSDAGVRAGDRVEHASVAPPEAVEALARLGVAVVTQPGFLRTRGDAYLRDVEAQDQPWLYRCAGFDAAGVPLGGSTDAPYGPADPWLAMQAAVDRRTAGGQVVASAEALTPERALALFTTHPMQAGGPQRRLSAGLAADLCLLDVPWERARDRLDAADVRATFIDGAQVFDAHTS